MAYVDVYVDGQWKRVDTSRPGAEDTIERAAEQARRAADEEAARAENARGEAEAEAAQNRVEAAQRQREADARQRSAEQDERQRAAKEAALYRARLPVLDIQQRILDAEQNVGDQAAVAQANRQRGAYDYRYGLAGMQAPQALYAPAGAQMGNLPPGLFYQPLTIAEQLERFALPQAELEAEKVSAAPASTFADPKSANNSSSRRGLLGLFGGGNQTPGLPPQAQIPENGLPQTPNEQVQTPVTPTTPQRARRPLAGLRGLFA